MGRRPKAKGAENGEPTPAEPSLSSDSGDGLALSMKTSKILPIEPVEVATLIATLLEAVQPCRHHARLVPQHLALLQHGVVMHSGSRLWKWSLCAQWSVCSCAQICFTTAQLGPRLKRSNLEYVILHRSQFAVEKSASTHDAAAGRALCSNGPARGCSCVRYLPQRLRGTLHSRCQTCDRGLELHS